MKHPIAIIRKERGLTQASLARLLKVSTATVASFEVGIRRPGDNYVDQMSKFFGLTSKTLNTKITKWENEQDKMLLAGVSK